MKETYSEATANGKGCISILASFYLSQNKKLQWRKNPYQSNCILKLILNYLNVFGRFKHYFEGIGMYFNAILQKVANFGACLK